ncbi:MAG: hypothetical protein ACM3SR_11065 [Ignavibacteriales bacterium]
MGWKLVEVDTDNKREERPITEKPQSNLKPDTMLNLESILQLRLSELSKRNRAIKIYSEVLGCEIWLCGTEQMVTQLRQDDPEVITYTAGELKRLMSLNPDPKGLMNIHIAKSVFPGSKIIDSRLKEANDGPDGT